MIRSPLGLRINPDPGRSPRDQWREAARLGARGVVLDAAGDLAPDRLGASGRRDVGHALRSVELTLIALHLPTRRPFDTLDGLDDRLARAARAFAMAYELGARLVLARVGPVPPEDDAPRREALAHALTELGRLADHQGVRLAIETGTEPGSALRTLLDALANPGLAASVDAGALLRLGLDPIAAVRDLGLLVAHAYATSSIPTSPARRTLVANPRGFGFPPGALDWEEYLGALEEIDYRSFLTLWPDPNGDQAAEFRALAARLNAL